MRSEEDHERTSEDFKESPSSVHFKKYTAEKCDKNTIERIIVGTIRIAAEDVSSSSLSQPANKQ
jgi:hypothetical protein